MNWKHRKPGEHLWYFNRESLDHLSNILTGLYIKCL